MFEIRNFEDLHKDKIKNSEIVPVHCKYFFSFDNNFMFIKKSKKFYQLCASCQCGFEPAFRQSTFDILYYNENLDNFLKVLFLQETQFETVFLSYSLDNDHKELLYFLYIHSGF